MANQFFIGDTHFYHTNIIKYEDSRSHFKDVNHMNETLIENWNSVVGKNDKVFHAGDVVFGGHDKHKILSRLNGKIYVILGNHDKARYLEPYVERFDGCKEFDGGIITHIPVNPQQFGRYKFNIHGHLHSNILIDPRYINVSCEHWNLTPVPWEVLKKCIEL